MLCAILMSFFFFPFYRELRNLVEPVLSRYRWNRRKPCSSLRSSARLHQYANDDKVDSGRKTAQSDDQSTFLQSSSSSSSSAADDASREADELESRIAASDLYRWIVPEFEILNLVPAKRPPMSRRRKPSSPTPPQQKGKKSLAKFKPLPTRGRQLPGLLSGGSARSSSTPKGTRKRGKKRRRRRKWGGGGGQSEWRPVGNITVEAATVNTILYIGADQVPSYISLDGPEFAPNSRPTLYMTNSGKHRFRVVTNIAPPFVIESTKLDNNTCLTGDFCLKVSGGGEWDTLLEKKV